VGGRGGLVTTVKTKLDCESFGRILMAAISRDEEETSRERPLRCIEGTPGNGGEAMGRSNRCLRGYFT
jgi:hypothetical protein